MSFKKLHHNKFVQFLSANLIYLYIKLVHYSSKVNLENFEYLNELAKKDHNFIFAFWHGRELMVTNYLRKYGAPYSIVSLHKDGDLVSKILEKFGSTLIRGSSSKGGSSVLRNILKTLKKSNNNICISPDGPRGPSMVVGGAVIDIAKMSNAPIIPLTFSAKKAKILPSWDSFMVPLPFNNITIKCLAPISVPRNATTEDIEHYKQKLESDLNQATINIDKKYHIITAKPGTIKKKNDTDI